MKTIYILSIILICLCPIISAQTFNGDFYAPWLTKEAENHTNHTDWIVPSTTPNAGYQHGNWPGRYVFPAWLQAYQTDRRMLNLQHFSNGADNILSYAQFSDTAANIQGGPANANGYVDGYRGWGNVRWTSLYALPPEDSIVQGKEYRYIIRVQHMNGQIRNRVWISDVNMPPDPDTDAPDYESYYVPTTTDPFSTGTIALLSGWSHTRFKDLKISHIDPSGTLSLLYDASSRYSTFTTDWSCVGSDTSMTAHWQQWKMESTGEIHCDAANTIPVEYTGVVRRFVGRYAALVFHPENLGRSEDSLQDVQVDCVIRIDQRNIANAESGIAVKWLNPLDPTPEGRVEGECLSSLLWQDHYGNLNGESYQQQFFGGGQSSITTLRRYFKPSTVYLAFKLRPHNCLEAISHDRRNGTGSRWWIGPYDVDADCALNNSTNEPGYYDEELPSDAINAAMMGFYKRYADGTPVEANARSAVEAVENNFIRKWETCLSRDRATWNYGGGGKPLGSLSIGGWQSGLVQNKTLGRIGLMFSSLYHSGSGSYRKFYEKEYAAIAQDILQNGLIRTGDRYLWEDARDYIGELSTATITDIGHTGPMILFLYNAWKDSTLTGVRFENLDTLARTFTGNIWNGVIGPGMEINSFNDGSGGDILQSGISTILTDWALLSCADFKVWEICFDYISNTWPVFSPHGQAGMWGRVGTDMLYAVRYGIPRNLRLVSVSDCEGSVSLLRWEPPSDYPAGRNAKPGTRLRYYNIYRKASPNRSRKWSDWYRIDQLYIPDLQAEHDYPFYVDMNPMAQDSVYAYMVRTQDWSSGITNESYDSNEILFTPSFPVRRVRMLRATPGGAIVETPTALVVRSDTALTGLYYLHRTITVNPGVRLTISPNSVLTFMRETMLSVHGTLSAVDTVDQDCWTTFQGEDDLPGSWTGIVMQHSPGMSNHDLFHCRIRNGVTNILIYNYESRLEQCDISGASDKGVVYADGSSHLHRNNFIHDNETANILLFGKNTSPTIYGDRIKRAVNGEGIAIIDGAWPTLEACIVTENARNGITLWHTGNLPPFKKTTIIHCTVSQNGKGHSADGIQLLDAQAVLRQSTIAYNKSAGIALSDGSYLTGGPVTGLSGSNSLDGNAINIKADQSGCSFGVTAPGGLSSGHLNCVTSPGNLQVEARNGSILSVEENFYDQDTPQWFRTDSTSYIFRTKPLISCSAAPSAGRVDSVEVSSGEQRPDLAMRKISSLSPVQAIIGLLSHGYNSEAVNLLKEILNTCDRSESDAVLTISRLVLRETRDQSILPALQKISKQGRLDETRYQLIKSDYYRQSGMFTVAKSALASIGEGISPEQRKSIELEKTYLTILLKGQGRRISESERLNSLFPGDPLVDQIAGYLPYVSQREDLLDTLSRKEAPLTETPESLCSVNNYPNPFNPQTVIQYTLAKEMPVRVTVTDLLGREIALLADGTMTQGSHSATFDGSEHPSGTYFYRVVAGEEVITKKILLVR